MGPSPPDAEGRRDRLFSSIRIPLVLLLQVTPRIAPRSSLRDRATDCAAGPRVLLRASRRIHVRCRLRSDQKSGKELRGVYGRAVDSFYSPLFKPAVAKFRLREGL